jgi:hypothetical protein
MDTAKLDQEFCTNELLGTSMARNSQYCLQELDGNPTWQLIKHHEFPGHMQFLASLPFHGAVGFHLAHGKTVSFKGRFRISIGVRFVKGVWCS